MRIDLTTRMLSILIMIKLFHTHTQLSNDQFFNDSRINENTFTKNIRHKGITC